MDLDKRMKRYEEAREIRLIKGLPFIILLDGRAFHTYTKSLNAEKPFDEKFARTFWETTKYLCKEIQGVRLGYTQSDEISLLVLDQGRNTEGWFDYRVNKIISVSASLATAKFNRAMENEIFDPYIGDEKYLATFSSTVFILPYSEVTNYFIWRQADATRNSIQSLGQDYFSHNAIQGKSNDEVQDMLMKEWGVNWNDFDVWKKRGQTIIKTIRFKRVKIDETTSKYTEVKRRKWELDETPIFTQERSYIENLLKEDYDGISQKRVVVD